MPTMYEGLGIEEVVDDLEIAIAAQLEDAFSVVSARLDERDRARAERHSEIFYPIEFEPIPLLNFHQGSVPSFVMSADRESNYPLVAIVPDRAAPDAEDARMDHYDVLNNAITVHMFAKASPTLEERQFDVCYRRAVRYGAAVNRIVRTDPTLRRQLSGSATFAQLRITEPWLFSANNDGVGDDWCWQAAGTDFMVKNYSITP